MTAVDENGDTALTVAKSPSMVRLLKGKPGGLIVGLGAYSRDFPPMRLMSST